MRERIDMDDRLAPVAPIPAADCALRYLELLKGCLTRRLFIDEEVIDVLPAQSWPFGDPDAFWAMLERNGWRLVRKNGQFDERIRGADYPPHAETMIGSARLDNLQELATRVIAEDVPGDLVETGIWRGGAVVLMRAVLAAYGDEQRQVWACDSFEGLPEPDVERYPIDDTMTIADPTVKHLMDRVLAVPVEQVQESFQRYGLLDHRVHFVKGWFGLTLPVAPIESISLLRLDGDLYESTMDAIVNLEPKVSPGGFVIVDDYSSVEACQQAVDEYRDSRGIKSPIHAIDWTGIWWRKESDRATEP